MKLTLQNDEIAHVRKLLRQGEELKCMRYLEQEKGMSQEEALKAVEMVKTLEKVKSNPLAALNLFKSQKKRAGKTTRIFRYLSLALFIWAVVLLLYYAWFMYSSVKVEGVVSDVDISYSTNEDGYTTSSSFPIFSYEYEGEIYRYESNSSSSLYTGDEVELYVNPDDPTDALPDTFSEVFGGFMMLLIWAAILYGVSKVMGLFGI